MPNYWDYLNLDRLLDLQGGVTGDEKDVSADELHFIVVHQTYELWFKVVLRDLRAARDVLAAEFVPEDRVPGLTRGLERATAILRLGVAQFEAMEELSPQGFLEFRDKLVPASGFQSFQLRELEILLGLSDEERHRYGESAPLSHIRRLAGDSPAGKAAWGRIEAAREEQSLRSALDSWLYRTPIRGSVPGDEGDGETVDRFLADYLDAAERHQGDLADHMKGQADPDGFLTAGDDPWRRRVRAALLFIESYRHLPLLAWPRRLLGTVVEMEQQMLLWRNRHARMVERMIGRRVGTGGSSGVAYLDRTRDYRIFTDLWAVRTLLLPRAKLPPLEDEGFYGFAGPEKNQEKSE